LFNLQKGGRASELKTHAFARNVIELGDLLGDFADTAAALDMLDLLVTVDTSVAHLAGAMGRPVWLLLPFAPDWRWLRSREDSPWYPTMHLFRQNQPGNWTEVFERVGSAMATLAVSRQQVDN
jgi:ADP-heptose:LPS heptosyltransferase